MTEEDRRNVFDEGYAAYGEGLPDSANKYNVGTESHDVWDDGWTQHMVADRGDRHENIAPHAPGDAKEGE